MRMRITLLVAIACVAGFLIDPAVAAPSRSREASGPALQQAAALDDAVRAYVEAQGQVYAGACAEAELPDDVGKYCSQVLSTTGAQAEVAIGPAFSEFTEVVTFAQSGGMWQATGVAPPAAGAGVTKGGSGANAWALAIAAAGGLAAAALVYRSGCRRETEP